MLCGGDLFIKTVATKLMRPNGAWAATNAIDVVVWTDLQSNFQKTCGKPFTVEAALAHLHTLGEKEKSGAAEYVWRAPEFIKTPLRTALEAERRFSR